MIDTLTRRDNAFANIINVPHHKLRMSRVLCTFYYLILCS